MFWLLYLWSEEGVLASGSLRWVKQMLTPEGSQNVWSPSNWLINSCIYTLLNRMIPNMNIVKMDWEGNKITYTPPPPKKNSYGMSLIEKHQGVKSAQCCDRNISYLQGLFDYVICERSFMEVCSLPSASLHWHPGQWDRKMGQAFQYKNVKLVMATLCKSI